MAIYCEKCGTTKGRIRRVTMFSHQNDIDGTAAIDSTLCRKCEREWKKIASKWLKHKNVVAHLFKLID